MIVVTHFPSPYQVELFNEIERQRPGELRVLYLFQRVASRKLERRADHPRPRLPGSRQRGGGIGTGCREPRAVSWSSTTTTIPSRPAHSDPRREPAANRGVSGASGRATVFRGWRASRVSAGWRHCGRATRRSGASAGGRSMPIARSSDDAAPISTCRITRISIDFSAARPTYSPDVTFLFSGSLIHRKGVDLLAQAFLRAGRGQPSGAAEDHGRGTDCSRGCSGCWPASNRVEWVGFKDWDELPAVYAVGADSVRAVAPRRVGIGGARRPRRRVCRRSPPIAPAPRSI